MQRDAKRRRKELEAQGKVDPSFCLDVQYAGQDDILTGGASCKQRLGLSKRRLEVAKRAELAAESHENRQMSGALAAAYMAHRREE